MRTRFGRWSVRVFGVALLMGAVTAALYATHRWGNYHWARTSNPFTLKLGDNVTGKGDWGLRLAEASADWSNAPAAWYVLDTDVVPGQATTRRCKATSMRVEVCADTYGFNGWLGLAQIWVSGSHITQGIAKMNNSYFNTSTYNSYPWRQYVMCQEVGHTFGLDHQNTTFDNKNLGSCMDYTNDPAGTGTKTGPLNNLSPNDHDYEELYIIYSGHFDSTTTVGQIIDGPGRGKMPPAMTDIDLAGPDQWGRVVKGSQAQGYSVHELDFGGGNKIYTFVTWVRPDHRAE